MPERNSDTVVVIRIPQPYTIVSMPIYAVGTRHSHAVLCMHVGLPNSHTVYIIILCCIIILTDSCYCTISHTVIYICQPHQPTMAVISVVLPIDLLQPHIIRRPEVSIASSRGF